MFFVAKLKKPTTGSDWRQMALWSGTTNYVSTAVTPYSSDSTNTWEISLNSYGGITIGRDVLVQKKLIKSVTMFIKASSEIASGSVVLKWNSNVLGYTFPTITTSWTNYTLLVSTSDAVPSNFTEIGFTNLKSTSVKFYVDNLVLNLENNVVVDVNTPVVTNAGVRISPWNYSWMMLVACLAIVSMIPSYFLQ